MADSKITALTALTAADPANDMIPIVDVSDTPPASGNTKRISINNILACSPSATLASATITGDLTVRTNKLAVTSTGVGCGTASPTEPLHVNKSSGTGTFIRLQDSANTNYIGTDNGNFRLLNGTSPVYDLLNIQQLGVFTFGDGAGGTRMTLNANGLGVGIGPSYKFHVQQTLAGTASAVNPIAYIVNNGSGNTAKLTLSDSVTTDGNITLTGSATVANRLLGFGINGVQQMVLDGNGNVGVGVTPITSHILSTAGPVGISGTTAGSRTSYITNSSAASIYYTDGGASGFFADFGNLIIQPRTSAPRSVVIATGSTTPVERAVVKSTGQVRFVPLAADPAGAESGDVYYNSVSNKLKCYNGTTWNDLF